ncbi:acyltransferase family protein [Dermabacteraceae bacterium P7006]
MSDSVIVPPKKRLLWVDSLRGIAIILVVFHHSFIVVPHFSNFVESANNAVVALRMPLLFFVSGCMVPGSLRKGMFHYFDSRIRHALWPYLGWQAQAIVMLGSAWGLLELQNWGPISHLWFLFFILVYYALAPIFVGRVPWFAVGVTGILLWSVLPNGNILGELGFHSFFFFMGAQLFPLVRKIKASTASVLISCMLLVLCVGIAWFGVETYSLKLLLLSILGGGALICLFVSAPENALMEKLAWVGRRSVVFYVVHFPVQVYLNLALESLGVVDTPLVWLVSLVFVYCACTVMGALRYKMPFSILFEMPKSWAPWNWKRDEVKRDLAVA